MKYILTALVVLVSLVFVTSSAYAAPVNAGDKNPQVVALYLNGPHSIVGEPDLHYGMDIVMRDGNSNNFQQWFFGTSQEFGGKLHGDHSVWKYVGTGTTCPAKWTWIEHASVGWGDYLTPGNYCVMTNDYQVTH